MRFSSFPFILFILTLFFASSVVLTMRQESLQQEAKDKLVTIGFIHPEDKKDTQFFIHHEASTPLEVTLDYQREDTSTTSENVTVNPDETRIFTPDPLPRLITVRYHDDKNEEHALSLYKK